MLIAIRDDDTSFWTSPDQLERCYGPIWSAGGKVSLAVIPMAYRYIGLPEGKPLYLTSEKKPVHENIELVKFILPLVKNKQIEIMLHGYDHSYWAMVDNNLPVLFNKEIFNNIKTNSYTTAKIPECIKKSSKELFPEILEGKKILEDTFSTNVKVFVPPSNAISRDAATAVINAGLNISGIMYKNFNRPITYSSVEFYFKKIIFKLLHSKFNYPWTVDYGTHRELTAYGYSHSTSIEQLFKNIDFCKKNNAPFVFATHYWDLLNNPSLHHNLLNAIDDLSSLKSISEIINEE